MGFLANVFGRVLNPKKKQTDDISIAFQNQVKIDGVPHAARRIAEEMNEYIDSKELARQFVLEELDAARQGDEYAVNFAINSGFSRSEYIGAMQKTKWGGDSNKLEHIQLFMRNFTHRLNDIDLMCKLQTSIVDEIMKLWKLGKYS